MHYFLNNNNIEIELLNFAITLRIFKISMLSVRAYSRNLGQCSILARKGTFFEKRVPKVSSPLPLYSIPFLSVLHQNEALHNFPKRGQRSIVKCNIGLEYALFIYFYEGVIFTSLQVFIYLEIIYKLIYFSPCFIISAPFMSIVRLVPKFTFATNFTC